MSMCYCGSQCNAGTTTVTSIMGKVFLILFESWCQIFRQSDWLDAGDITFE